MPRSLIACRLSCYRPHESLAAAHLAGLGVDHVEVRLPPPAVLAETSDWSEREAERLTQSGLSATTVHADLDLTRADVAEQITGIAPHLRAFGCPRLLIALRPMPLYRAAQCARLREAGIAAAAAGLVITLETHPDLAANAEQALDTLARVDHPAVRLNFDTANIPFYNHDLDCVRELIRVASLVESVHLKDTPGGFGERCFPALGNGVIDFPGVFGALDAAGFDGPYTLEIEGIAGEERSADLILQRIAESVSFLRRLGRL